MAAKKEYNVMTRRIKATDMMLIKSWNILCIRRIQRRSGASHRLSAHSFTCTFVACLCCSNITVATWTVEEPLAIPLLDLLTSGKTQTMTLIIARLRQ